MKDYKELIRHRRQELGISQNQLAKRVGISQPFMAEIESGRKKPSLDVLMRICAELGIELFGGTQG